jgi:DnaJ-class molecular chaperone
MNFEQTQLDYYSILGVGKNTTPGQVAEMYELLKKHPLNQDIEIQLQIEMAYSVISQPDMKAEYDNLLTIACQNQLPIIVNKISTNEERAMPHAAISAAANEAKAFLSCFLIGIGLALMFGAGSYLIR